MLSMLNCNYRLRFYIPIAQHKRFEDVLVVAHSFDEGANNILLGDAAPGRRFPNYTKI